MQPVLWGRLAALATIVLIMADKFVKIIVGTSRFKVSESCFQKHPNSFFAVALKPHWNNDMLNSQELSVEGINERLFKYIVGYMECGGLPRNSNGDCLLSEVDLTALRSDADYFQLPSLVADIDEALQLTPNERAVRCTAKVITRSENATPRLGTTSYSDALHKLGSTLISIPRDDVNGIMNTIEEYLTTDGPLGVYLMCDYRESGLSSRTLKGTDRAVYEAVISRGIPVSAVFVQKVRTSARFAPVSDLSKFDVFLLDSDHDTRHVEHMGLHSIRFTEALIRFEGEKPKFLSAVYEIVCGRVSYEREILSALIIGSKIKPV